MQRIICNRCNGLGTIRDRDYGEWSTVKCSRCEGEKIILRKVFVLEIPLSKEGEGNKKVSEILDIINKPI